MLRACLVSVVFAVACAPPVAAPHALSGPGPAPDAGAPFDAGPVVSGGPDAGADAGTSSEADAGTDAGPAGTPDAGWTLDQRAPSPEGGGDAAREAFTGILPTITLEPAPGGACGGLVPAALPPPQTLKAANPRWAGGGRSVSDLGGNLATSFGLFGADGRWLGDSPSSERYWLPHGFLARSGNPNRLAAVRPDGTVRWERTDDAIWLQDPAAQIGPDGSLAWTSFEPDANGRSAALRATRIDADGNLAASVLLAPYDPALRPAVAVGLDGAMLVAYGASAWWIDAEGAVTGPYAIPSAADHRLARLPDGSFASGDLSSWQAVVTRAGTALAAPSWLNPAPGTLIRPLPGGVLALISFEPGKPRRVAFVAADGTPCGVATFQGEPWLMPDGTLLADSTASLCDGLRCTATLFVWPRLFDAEAPRASGSLATFETPYDEGPPQVTVVPAAPASAQCAGLLPHAVPPSWVRDAELTWDSCHPNPVPEVLAAPWRARDGGELVFEQRMISFTPYYDGSRGTTELVAHRLDAHGVETGVASLGKYDWDCSIGGCSGRVGGVAEFLADGTALAGVTIEGRLVRVIWVAPLGSLASPFVEIGNEWGEKDAAFLEYGGGFLVRANFTWRGLLIPPSSTFAPLPPAFAAHPRSHAAPLPGGGIALLPVGYEVAPSCVQELEILAPDGEDCGAVRIAASQGACAPRNLSIAADGTLIRDDVVEVIGAHRSCTERKWPLLFAR